VKWRHFLQGGQILNNFDITHELSFVGCDDNETRKGGKLRRSRSHHQAPASLADEPQRSNGRSPGGVTEECAAFDVSDWFEKCGGGLNRHFPASNGDGFFTKIRQK
jgi:hypothetical protein